MPFSFIQNIKEKVKKESDADATKKNCRRGPKSKWNVGTSDRPKLSVIRHKVKCIEQTQSPINAKRFLTMILLSVHLFDG